MSRLFLQFFADRFTRAMDTPYLETEVEVSLGKHPEQTGRRHNQWARQTLVKLAVLEPQPFRSEVKAGHSKSPDTECVHGLVAHQVVGTVESNNGSQKRPGSKSTSTQVCHFGLGCRRVHFAGKTEIFDQVGLGGVENRHHRDEKQPVGQKATLGGGGREEQRKGEHWLGMIRCGVFRAVDMHSRIGSRAGYLP